MDEEDRPWFEYSCPTYELTKIVTNLNIILMICSAVSMTCNVVYLSNMAFDINKLNTV